MSNAMSIAKKYFELSNKSDFDEIEKLFTATTIYISPNTGNFVGKDKILKMQRAFHSKFSSLKWDVNSVKEIRPGVILFDYDFVGVELGGKKISSSGLEYVTVGNEKIQRVEIRSKSNN